MAPAVQAATAQQLGRYMTPPLLSFPHTHPFGCCTLEPWIRGKMQFLHEPWTFRGCYFLCPSPGFLVVLHRSQTYLYRPKSVFSLIHVLRPIFTCSHAELNLESLRLRDDRQATVFFFFFLQGSDQGPATSTAYQLRVAPFLQVRKDVSVACVMEGFGVWLVPSR